MDCDIPGLILESGSFDALLERTRFAVPELLELNVPQQQSFSLLFILAVEKTDRSV